MDKDKTRRRFVNGNVLISSELPDIQVRVSEAFHYLGTFDFTIPEIAAGERYIFAETHGHKINRLFIAQFEAILPQSTITYNYRFDDALTLGTHKFRQNTYAYSNGAARQENPQGEAALTADFLSKRNYHLQDELMMSRFVTVPDQERKHELILFYIENVSESGRQLEDFYMDDQETELWKEISWSLTRRSFENFEVTASPV